MKWIGQHIWNFVSRFRNDVYVESLVEQDQDFSVMVSSNGKLTKSNYPIERSRIRVRNDEGSTIPVGGALYCKGYADNRILVGLCDNSDPAKMPCIGIAEEAMNITDTKDNYAIASGLFTTTIPVTGALLVNLPLYVGDDGYLNKLAPTASGSVVQCVGVVVKTDGGNCEILSLSITNQVRDRDVSGIKGLQDTSVDVKSEADLKFYIDSDDGADTNKFYWYDHTNSIMELDNSGNLQIDGGLTTGSTSFVNSSGVVQVATQGTIDHDSLANSGGSKHIDWTTYQGTTNIAGSNVDHDTLTNFVANEHIDWTAASAGTVHSTNIPTLNQNTTGSSASCTGNSATATALTSGDKTITGNLTVTGQLSAIKRKFVSTDTATHFDVQGDILYFGSGSTTQGDLCYLKEDGTWGQADADGAAVGDDADRDAMGMLAIALGTNPLTDGMFIRGIITMDYDLGDVGNPIYVKVTAGGMSYVAPSTSGDFVRVVGYCLDDNHGVMYFNPDNTWVEIA